MKTFSLVVATTAAIVASLLSFHDAVDAFTVTTTPHTAAARRGWTTTTKSTTTTTTTAHDATRRPSFAERRSIRSTSTRPTTGSSRPTTVLFMGWGPDPIWTSATVKSNQPACKSNDVVNIVMQVSAETASEYKVPGQYVQVKVGEEKPVFLAIASPPLEVFMNSGDDDGDEEKKDDDTAVAAGLSDDATFEFEFLVKKTDNNEWLTSAGVDADSSAEVEISQVLGNGFAMTEHLDGFKYDFPTQNVILCAAGTGIAPIRAAMESGMLQTPPRTARLYYGVRTPQDLCYRECFQRWEEEAGIQVVPVISQPTPEDDWSGRTGYVQNALEEDGIPIPRNSGALLCGMKGMTESVKAMLEQAGVFEGRILFNF